MAYAIEAESGPDPVTGKDPLGIDLMKKNAAAQALAELRWSRIPMEQRSEIMRQVRAATPFKKKLRKTLKKKAP